MDNEKTIDVLNTLIQINNDRVEGYETAAKETEEQDLKTFFGELTQTSLHCRKELVEEVSNLGGEPTDSTKITGKFFRVWMDVKAALTGKDRKDILDSCEYGEDAAKETYQNVLKNDSDFLSLRQQNLVREQQTMLLADHDKVKIMRNSYAEAE